MKKDKVKNIYGRNVFVTGARNSFCAKCICLKRSKGPKEERRQRQTDEIRSRHEYEKS